MMGMDQQFEMVDVQVCATHTEQLKSIGRDVREIKGDIKTVLPIVAVHAEKLGKLENRMDRVEGQMNWGKWLAGVSAAIAALVTYLQGRVP